jgi:hypothetical protein
LPDLLVLRKQRIIEKTWWGGVEKGLGVGMVGWLWLWLAVAGSGWLWLAVVGCGWLWLAVAGCG